MSMIQEELVREAILAVCFPLVDKQRKGRRSGELQSSQSGQLKIQLPSVERRKQSAQEQLIAILWLVEKGTGQISQSWWLYSNEKCVYNVPSTLSVYDKSSPSNTDSTNDMQMRLGELACDLHTFQPK